MPKRYCIYFIYTSKPLYLQIKYLNSWSSIGAVLQFKKIKKPNMQFIGVARLNKEKNK